MNNIIFSIIVNHSVTIILIFARIIQRFWQRTLVVSGIEREREIINLLSSKIFFEWYAVA